MAQGSAQYLCDPKCYDFVVSVARVVASCSLQKIYAVNATLDEVIVDLEIIVGTIER